MKKNFKEDFDKWLKEFKPVTFKILGYTFNFSSLKSFEYLPKSMQWGVYLSFLWEKYGLCIWILPVHYPDGTIKHNFEIINEGSIATGFIGFYSLHEMDEGEFETPNKAQEQAIKKAIEIYETF